jgi:4-hydroxy-2-oxoglutarate aldolase
MFGVPGLKLAMDNLGYYGGPTRLPMVPLTQQQVVSQREIFKESGYM